MLLTVVLVLCTGGILSQSKRVTTGLTFSGIWPWASSHHQWFIVPPGCSSLALHKHRVSRCMYRKLFMIITLEHSGHFRSLVQAKQTKLKMYKGSTHLICDPSMAIQQTGVTHSVKLFCCVAVTPHLRLSKGKRIPADRVCSSLHVSFKLIANHHL